jgi:hypothetical protein
MQGLPFTLYGLMSVTPLGEVPWELGAPLALLPLLGWAALGGRAGLFAAGLAWHLHEVSRHLLPSDRLSPSWLAFRGLGGWTGNLVTSSILYELPSPLAAPLVLLPLVGWAVWMSPLGLFCTMLFAGYGGFFMIAGRANNFYWALVVVPAWFVGYAFLPMALKSLLASARGAKPYGAS